MEILIKPWAEAQNAAFLVRQEVFIWEQGVPEELEIDEMDPSAIHALAYIGTQCVGTARLVDLGDGRAQIGRMAVLVNFRNQGIGWQILENLIGRAKYLGISFLVLHSQLTAIPFYEKFGFIAEGPAYDEAGIDHRNMILSLPQTID